MIVPFRLQLSAPASDVKIDTGRAVESLNIDHSPIIGHLTLDPENPHLALTIHWKYLAAPEEHRFAKLTLEIPGQDTIRHVFDAAGDVDDFLELPLPKPP